MINPTISAIVVLGINRAMGKDNKLIWDIPDDLKRFHQKTAGHPIIMGRKTHESIGRVLSNRVNIIVTRNENYQVEGCAVVSSLEKAIDEAKKHELNEIFIIGGGEIYKQALPFTDKLYLTLVNDSPEADVFFPDYSDFTKVVFEEKKKHNNIEYKYIDLER